MAKQKTIYVCQSCGYRSPRWMGRCPDCDSWNSLIEELEPARRTASKGSRSTAGAAAAVPVTQVEVENHGWTPTGIGEFDRILGKGVVSGSLVLVGGDPGIGKSTLMLQVASRLAREGRPVLYVSGEESTVQTRGRAERLDALSDQLSLYPEVDLGQILSTVEQSRPWAVVIDSIQTVYHPDLQGPPGSVSQIRECTAGIMRLAKSLDVTFFLIGHVTKSGAIAGPRLLEHMVDTVLYFEGDRHHAYRILRAVKNRFGSTDEIGVFEMTPAGLREVDNPSKIFLSHRGPAASGSVVVGSVEGTRPLLVEVQALVSSSNYGVPQRVVSGMEHGRLVMLLAVLEKRYGLRLGNQDVFVNAAGGIRLSGPSVDLGMAVAIVSSYKDRPAPPQTMVVGEVGLGGEVRPVRLLGKRIREAQKLGFKRCVVPRASLAGEDGKRSIEVTGVEDVGQALDQLLGSWNRKGTAR
jgi:DNA repair protein RadA/Sms